MTSTRRRKAPLAPGAGISTRSSRGSRWSSRRLQLSALLRLVIMSKLVLVAAPASAPAVLQSVLFGQKLEDTYWGTRRVVDVASPTVLEEHDCSGAAPCWALVKEDTPLAPFAGGVQLASLRSMAWLRTYSHNTGCTQSVPRSLRGVLNHDILAALHAMDPMSYVFAYRTSENKVRCRL
jgi:hypothetical protein